MAPRAHGSADGGPVPALGGHSIAGRARSRPATRHVRAVPKASAQKTGGRGQVPPTPGRSRRLWGLGARGWLGLGRPGGRFPRLRDTRALALPRLALLLRSLLPL